MKTKCAAICVLFLACIWITGCASPQSLGKHGKPKVVVGGVTLEIIKEEHVGTVDGYELYLEAYGTKHSKQIKHIIFTQIKSSESGRNRKTLFSDDADGEIKSYRWKKITNGFEIWVVSQRLEPLTGQLSILEYQYLWAPPNLVLGTHAFSSKERL